MADGWAMGRTLSRCRLSQRKPSGVQSCLSDMRQRRHMLNGSLEASTSSLPSGLACCSMLLPPDNQRRRFRKVPSACCRL